MLVSFKTRGACRALVWTPADRRYHCGLLRTPRLRWLRPLLRRWIAAGTGCDAALQVHHPR
jgi:hypothetical protein